MLGQLLALCEHALIRLSISADYLASRCQASLDCMNRLHDAREAFLADNTGETQKHLSASLIIYHAEECYYSEEIKKGSEFGYIYIFFCYFLLLYLMQACLSLCGW